MINALEHPFGTGVRERMVNGRTQKHRNHAQAIHHQPRDLQNREIHRGLRCLNQHQYQNHHGEHHTECVGERVEEFFAGVVVGAKGKNSHNKKQCVANFH